MLIQSRQTLVREKNLTENEMVLSIVILLCKMRGVLYILFVVTKKTEPLTMLLIKEQISKQTAVSKTTSSLSISKDSFFHEILIQTSVILSSESLPRSN